MGQFDPSTRETKLFVNQFLEAAKLQGTAITIMVVTKVDRDLYKDPDYTYEHAQKLDVILNERPNRYVLDSYGWYNEDDEVVPMIMYVAKFDQQGKVMKPLTGSVVILPYELAEDEKLDRAYMVSQTTLTNPSSWMWVCKLTPYRHPTEKEEPHPEYEVDPNFEFLDIKKK